MKLTLEIKLLSPLHLGSGKGDVVVDAEIVHDEYGLPYFPAKRVKGLLYESALEVAEMAKCCGENFVTKAMVDRLFGKDDSSAEFYVHDLTLTDYEDLRKQWAYLQGKFKNIVSPRDVLNSYTSLRYQTEIEAETGTAAAGSLHNMRVLDRGLVFCGEMVLDNVGDDEIKTLVLAVKNLKYAGAKRNRGFGEIECSLGGMDAEFDFSKAIGG